MKPSVTLIVAGWVPWKQTQKQVIFLQKDYEGVPLGLTLTDRVEEKAGLFLSLGQPFRHGPRRVNGAGLLYVHNDQ